MNRFRALLWALAALTARAQVVPQIQSFSYSSGSLAWSVSGAAVQSIDQGIGSVAASGSVAVNPGVTKVYTLRAATASSQGYYSQASVIVKPGQPNLTGVTLTTSANLTDVTKGTFGPGCDGAVQQHGVCQVTVCPASIAGIANVNYGDFTVVFSGQTTGSSYTVHGYHEVFGSNHCWKWNFQPPSAEDWNWSLTWAPAGLASYFTSSGSFTSVASTRPGFVRNFGPSAPTQFKTEDGSPFFPIGWNSPTAGSNNGGDDLSYPIPGAIGATAAQNGRSRFGNIAAAGFNLVVVEGGSGIHAISNQAAGNNTYYTGNSITATYPLTFDKICYDALEAGVHLQLALADNAYFFLPQYDPALNLSTTQSFWEAWQWAVNRWGYCTDIWQYQTEDGGGAGPQWKANFKLYYQSLGAFLAANDPYQHLRTTSFPAVCATCTWPSQPNPFPIDVISTSVYCSDPEGPSLNLANSIVATSCVEGHGISTYQGLMPSTPFVGSEGGNTGSPPYDSDPGYWERTRILQWVAAANGAYTTMTAGSGCTGLGNTGAGAICIGTQQLFQTALLSSFLASVDPHATALSASISTPCAAGQTLRSYARGSSAAAWGYIVNASNRSACAGAKMTVALPAAGTVIWYQPADGAQLAGAAVSGGPQAVAIPTFSADAYHGDIAWRWYPAAAVSVTTLMTRGIPVGGACNFTLTAGGGTAPYSWKVAAGALPEGCNLNTATGLVSGTAITAGYWSVKVIAVDATNSAAAPQLLRIGVFAPLSFPWSSVNAVTGLNTVIGFSVMGGVPPISAQMAGGFPGCGVTGYGIGPNCTPGAAGVSSLVWTVTDGSGGQASQAETVNVNAQSSSVMGFASTGPPFHQATAGVAYPGGVLNMLAVYGGSGSYTASVGSGSLPAGLSPSIQNGRAVFITGTPANAGTSTGTVTVSDNSGHSASMPVTLTVNPAVGVATLGLSTGTMGSPYLQRLLPSNGTAPFAWFVYPGSALPPGVTLDYQGWMGGVPAGAGAYNFTIGVMDANGSVATQAFAMTISAPGTACDLDQDGVVGVADVQDAIEQAQGTLPCSNASLEQNGRCTVVDVQRVVDAALGQGCRVGN